MIKRYSIIVGCVVVIVWMIIQFAGLYPVAMVNGSPIWYRTWSRYFRGTLHALTIQARSAGTQFNAETHVISAIKKNTLNTLIENAILAQAGNALIAEFDAASNQKIRDAMSASADIEKAASFLYGFNAKDFHNFVLFPQSNREVIQHKFDKQKINFAAWLSGVKKKAHIRLFVHSYTWDGDMLK